MLDYSVSISVVTHNSEKHIGKLLDSIINHIHGVDYHVYIIDNDSTDNTIQVILGKDQKRITLIESKKNIGFGSGHNLILNQINSKYHIFINPDIYFDYDVISDLSHFMDSNEDIGIVSPKVLYPDGQLQVLPKRNPKLRYLISRRVDIGILRKFREEYEMSDMDMDSAFEIEFSTGCFMFVRTDLLKKVGGFDKRYFLYFEDADLTRELRKYSRAQFNPQFYIYHHWERSGNKRLKFFLIQVSSMFIYMWKWKFRK